MDWALSAEFLAHLRQMDFAVQQWPYPLLRDGFNGAKA